MRVDVANSVETQTALQQRRAPARLVVQHRKNWKQIEVRRLD